MGYQKWYEGKGISCLVQFLQYWLAFYSVKVCVSSIFYYPNMLPAGSEAKDTVCAQQPLSGNFRWHSQALPRVLFEQISEISHFRSLSVKTAFPLDLSQNDE